MVRQTLRTEKWNRRFLELTAVIASWSKDPSTKVGAIIVDAKNRILSTGYNGFPPGVQDTEERLQNRDWKYPLTVHAEANAIIFARTNLEECTIYSSLYPCAPCAGKIAAAGIKQLVSYADKTNPRWIESFEKADVIFREAGVDVTLYDVQ
jgi:dCMP deaminase